MNRRPRLYIPLTDANGGLLRYAQVTVYAQDGATLFPGVLYLNDDDNSTQANPFVIAPGVVDLYLDRPARVVLGVVSDSTRPAVLSAPYDATVDSEELVYGANPLLISGAMPGNQILGALDPATAYWYPLAIAHNHFRQAARTLRIGLSTPALRQAGGYPNTTVVGAAAGAGMAPSSLAGATMLGFGAGASGRNGVAVGHDAYAEDGARPPWPDSAVALGHHALSRATSVAVGAQADAWALLGSATVGQAVVLGPQAVAGGPNAVCLGSGAQAASGGVAVGFHAGSAANGQPASVGLGADAQYGLPATVDPTQWAVLLGAHDPGADRVFPWANPRFSQSESWRNEYGAAMSFTARTVQLQRHLQWVLAGALQTSGDATLGRAGGTVGFYGAAPAMQAVVGDDEPASGIEALDNLIYALRDLGLLGQRSPAATGYVAADMDRAYLDGDPVARWDEHAGTDVATPLRAGHPAMARTPSGFNGFSAYTFVNNMGARDTQALRSANPLPTLRHVAVVAQHDGSVFGSREGLLNVDSGADNPGDTVLMAERGTTTTWAADTLSAPGANYVLDRLPQLGNLDANLDGKAHVYRVSNPSLWTHAPAVIGGPRDPIQHPDLDFWNGRIAEIVGMDATWDEAHVMSMTNGLMFKYHLGQDDTKLLTPAASFLLAQHDPISGGGVFFNQDYPDSYLGRISGRATNIAKPVAGCPWVNIFTWFIDFSYQGSIVGFWGNIGIDFHDSYRIKLTVSLDGATERELVSEFPGGRYFLEHGGMWSTGFETTAFGFKTAYLIRLSDQVTMARAGDPQTRYQDTEVRVYTSAGGTLTWQTTVPLWGDGTWYATLTAPGHKVVRVYETSTGRLLAASDTQEQMLPRELVVSTDDPDYTPALADTARTSVVALAALAFLELGQPYFYRVRNILRTLSSVSNADGSLNQTYSSSAPAAGMPNVRLRDLAWVGLAGIRYQQLTRDYQFTDFLRRLAAYLATRQVNGQIPRTPGSTSYPTEDGTIVYFFLREYASALKTIP